MRCETVCIESRESNHASPKTENVGDMEFAVIVGDVKLGVVEKSGENVAKQSGIGDECVTESVKSEKSECQWSEMKTKMSCKVCSKIFKSKRALNIHMTKMHTQPH